MPVVPSLWNQYQFATRFSRLTGSARPWPPMRFQGVEQRERLGDAHSQRAFGDPLQQVGRAGSELLRCRDVVCEQRSCEKERPLAVEHLWIDRRHRTAGLTAENHHAAWCEAIQAAVERVLP